MRIRASLLLLTAPLALAAIPVGTSGGAVFSLDPARRLITSIAAGGRKIIERARPMYDCSVGKRRGGFDQFFDFPPSHPDGTRSFTGQFRAASAKAWTAGDRVEVAFAGLRMGIFSGEISY